MFEDLGSKMAYRTEPTPKNKTENFERSWMYETNYNHLSE